MKIIFGFLYTFLIISCVPEQQETQFGITIKPEAGQDLEVSTMEDQSILIEYEVQKPEDSVDMSVELISPPKHGVLQECELISNTKWQCHYTPNENFNGTDFLEFRTKDGDFVSTESSTLTIKVLPVPDNPIAPNPFTEILPENKNHKFQLVRGEDVDSKELFYELVDSPLSGSLQNCFSASERLNCEYLPNKDFTGKDSFSYKVIDAQGGSSENKTLVNLKVLNYPEVNKEQLIQVPEKLKVVTFKVPSALDHDSDPNKTTYKVVKMPVSGTIENCFERKDSMTCSYIPNSGYTGFDEMNYIAIDDDGLESQPGKIIFRVNIKELPVIGADQILSTKQAQAITFQVNKATDADTSSELLNYVVVEPPINGVLLNCFGAVGNLDCTYVPNRNFYGTDSFKYNVTDNTGMTSLSSAVVKVNIEKRKAPVPSNLAITVDQYKAITFNIVPAIDPDSSAENIKYKIVIPPKNGVLSACFGAQGITSCTFTPTSSYYGLDSFTYKAIDEYDVSSAVDATVTIKVNRVNLPPIVGKTQKIEVEQDSKISFLINQGSDSETAEKNLKYTLKVPPINGTLTSCFTPTSPLSCTYTPKPNYYGADKFSYSVMDDEGLESLQNQDVTISVNKIQVAPVPGNKLAIVFPQAIKSGDSYSFSVPAGSVSNQSSDDLTYKLVSSPQEGLLNCFSNIQAPLNCSFTINNIDFYGKALATYNIADSTNLISKTLGEIEITIKDRPNPGEVLNLSLPEGASITFNVPQAIDNDSVAIDMKYAVKVLAKNGTISNCFIKNGNRECTYTSNPGYVGADLIEYSITDELDYASTTHGLINILITPKLLSGAKEFMQNAPSLVDSVDITWVIDNSGSMGGEQADLARNFSAFIDNFIVDDKPIFPFNMIVTTSDKKIQTDYIGKLNSEALVNDFAAMKADFQAAVNVGINGSYKERMYESTEDVIINQAAFYGKNNTLSIIIVVSDEPEQSSSKNAQQWASTFQQTKDIPSKVKVFNIIRQDLSSQRYIDVAKLTNGKNFDIKSDFSGILNEISTSVVNLVDSYLLDGNINVIEASLTVYIDNILQTPDKYTFSNNSIKFITPPEAGTTIKIEYDYTMKY